MVNGPLEIGGRAAVRRDLATRSVYATDNSIYQIEPAAVATPTSAAQVAQLLAENAQRPRPLPVAARGGGTGTNGQSLTDGLMIDMKRHMRAIVRIDPDRQLAEVEPGVVAGALNDALREHDLFWAPHTSTLNRATIGGMIATDAAGKGSLIHGRTHRHVEALEMCLADGSTFTAEAVPIDEAERRAAAGGTAGAIWRALLDLPIAEDHDFALPELARGFSGYGIDRLRRDDMLDPLALLVGAEGTLGIVTKATLRLTPIPTHTTLLIAGYPSFDDALRAAIDLRPLQPSAIECLDERTVAAARQTPTWATLGLTSDGDAHALLFLEFDSTSEIDPAALHTAITNAGRTTGVTPIEDDLRAAAWRVRADAVGLVAKVKEASGVTKAQPVAMVEDCAVPVEQMPEFIDEFRQLLDRHGLTYAMYGHADVGCVHVRPALDLTDPAHAVLVGTITDEVVELVASRGGILWGEHGRGFRGEASQRLLSAETIDLMEQVKSIFDPNDIMNPGKLYRPSGSERPLTKVTEAPTRGERNREIPVGIRHDFDDAFACNGNGVCQQHSASEIMCPSYTATGDPALSPKGRADLLRTYLSRPAQDDDPLADAIAENLNQCLSCAACATGCPVEVNIPELKSRFFARYYEDHSRPRAHRLLSRFETLATLAPKSPTLARYGTKPARSTLGLVDLPEPKASTVALDVAEFHHRKNPGPFDVVVLPDVFTARLEPDTMRVAIQVLSRLGLKVAVAPFVPSGKFDHVTGQRKRFASAVRSQAKLVESILSAGATPVAIEPATALLHSHDYPTFDTQYPAQVLHLVDVLHEHLDQLSEHPAGQGQEVTLLGHCTERALRPESIQKWTEVLNAVGYHCTVPDLGCCGMAGIFGHQLENQTISRTLWNAGWDGAARQPLPVATGYSCRSQAARFSYSTPPHPVHLLDT